MLELKTSTKSGVHKRKHPGIDIWATGVLAYEVMLGGPPFEADTKEETCDKILYSQPFMARMWSKKAHDFLHKVIPGSLCL